MQGGVLIEVGLDHLDMVFQEEFDYGQVASTTDYVQGILAPLVQFSHVRLVSQK